jgi:hypothetical protein
MKFTTANGEQLDTDLQWVSQSEVDNAVAEWNDPPPFGVRRGGTPALVTPPIPEERRPWLNQVGAAVNAELAAAGYLPLPLQIFWRAINGNGFERAPSRELREAIGRALVRLGDSIPDDAWRKRLAALASSVW